MLRLVTSETQSLGKFGTNAAQAGQDAIAAATVPRSLVFTLLGHYDEKFSNDP